MIMMSALYQTKPLVIPSHPKLRRDIVTLPSVRPSFRNILVNTRINILQWILTKLGTYLVLMSIWNPIDFQGHRSKVKVTGSHFQAGDTPRLALPLLGFLYRQLTETITCGYTRSFIRLHYLEPAIACTYTLMLRSQWRSIKYKLLQFFV